MEALWAVDMTGGAEMQTEPCRFSQLFKVLFLYEVLRC